MGKLASGFRENVISKRTLLALTVGVVSAVGVVVGEISLASLVFSGPLAPYSAAGVGLVLFGTFVGCLVIALSSGFKGAVSAPPVPTLIVMSAIGGAVAASGDVLFATMVAIIVLCALATGVTTWLIGRFRLANFIRFIPYPVSSGFVAGTGGVVCLVALSLMGVRFEAGVLATLFEPMVVANWAFGIAYGVCLYLATKRWSSFLLLPIGFIGAAAGFHLCLALLDIPSERAAEAGLLFAGLSEGRLWPAFGPDDLALVDWTAVAGQIPNMLTLVLVTLLCIVMYVGGLELAANRELDWNREFRAVGYAGMLSSLGGGPPGCMVVPTCLRSLMFGVDMRFTGIVAALAIGSTLLVGDALLSLVPVPLMGGVLLFTGIVMVDDWLVKVAKRVPRADYLIIVAMFLTIAAFGFFEGVGLGMLITIVFFIVRVSRVDLVESRYTARERHSNRMRPIPDRSILESHGERVLAYRLAGYMFFGSGYRLADELKASLGGAPAPRCILLDFDGVTGIDVSAVNAICRLVLAARGSGTRLVLCATPDPLRGELQRNLPPPAFADVLFETDADVGLERCEDMLLDEHRPAGDKTQDGTLLTTVADAMERHLDRQVWFEELLDELRDWTFVRECPAGSSIVAVDEHYEGVGLIIAGRASASDAAGRRLAQHGPGAVLGPLAAHGPSVAAQTVVAEEDCRIACLTPEAVRLLEANDGALALKLYRYLLWAEGDHSAPMVDDTRREEA